MKRLAVLPLLLAVLLAGCTGSEVSPEDPAPGGTGLVPAPVEDPTAAGAPGGTVESEQEGALAPTADEATPPADEPTADQATAAPAPAEGQQEGEGEVDEFGNRVPSAIESPSDADLPAPPPVPTNPPAPLPSPYEAVPEDGIPDPVEATEGVPVWGVYMAHGASPEDPAIAGAVQALDAAGEPYVVTDVSCEQGVSETLGLPVDATTVALYFQSERAAYYWLQASGAQAVGVAQVSPCGAVPAG